MKIYKATLKRNNEYFHYYTDEENEEDAWVDLITQIRNQFDLSNDDIAYFILDALLKIDKL
jgi:hypothetical protein